MLTSRLSDEPVVTEGEVAIEAVVRPAIPIGQAFLSDAVARRAIELRAMDMARRYYEAQWSEVFDVSSNASCDLHCRSGDVELRVEVKGTTGHARHILLTRNEVRLAHEHHPHTALFVVSHIELDRNVTPPIAHGGVAHEIRPWMPNSDYLVPTAYRYDFPAV